MDIIIQLASVLLFTAMLLYSNRLKHLMVAEMRKGDGCTRSLLFFFIKEKSSSLLRKYLPEETTNEISNRIRFRF
jgi:hypothetical protein